MSTLSFRWTNASKRKVTSSTTQRTTPPFANRSASRASPRGQSTSAASPTKNRLKAPAKRNSNSSFWSSCSSHLSHSLIRVDGVPAAAAIIKDEGGRMKDERVSSKFRVASSKLRSRLPTLNLQLGTLNLSFVTCQSSLLSIKSAVEPAKLSCREPSEGGIMKRLFKSLCALAAVVCAAGGAFAQAPSARFTVQEMLQIQRVADPQLSPDGRWVAYQITVPDVAANRNRTQIYLICASGGEPKQLTSGASSATTPRWSPDGARLAFVTGGQVWTMNPDGSDRKQLTNISTGASDPVWSPDGRWLAFASEVYPDCADDACNRQRDEEAEKNPVKPHVTARLFVRHWVDWKSARRSPVFVAPVEGGAVGDLTRGDWDAPPFSLGDLLDYAFPPDSKELAYARNTDSLEATSTNADIFVVAVAGGE